MKRVVVARFSYRHEAEYARGFLEDEGIPSVLQTADSAGAYAGMSFSNPATLVVRSEDGEEARRILTEAGVIGPGDFPEPDDGPRSEEVPDG